MGEWVLVTKTVYKVFTNSYVVMNSFRVPCTLNSLLPIKWNRLYYKPLPFLLKAFFLDFVALQSHVTLFAKFWFVKKYNFSRILMF